MKQKRLINFLPGTLWFFVILFLITLPKEEMPEIDGWWAWLDKLHVDKWVHAGMFAVQAILFMWPLAAYNLPQKEKWQWFLRVGMAVVGWGLATELIQLKVPGRSFDLMDWLADSLGVALALLAANKWLLSPQKPKNAKS